MDWAVICPHANAGHMPVDENIILAGCLAILGKCDAIYLLEGWGDSIGARAEYSLAVKLGLEIYEFAGG